MKLTALVVFVLLVALPVAAQEEPKETMLFRSLGWVTTGLCVVDVAQTADALARPGYREANPLMKPFAHHPWALAGVKSAQAIGLNYATSHLYKSHPKIATWVRVAVIGFTAVPVVMTFRAVKR